MKRLTTLPGPARLAPKEPRVSTVTPDSPLPGPAAHGPCDPLAGRQRQVVRAFYDEVGWRASEEHGFEDGRRFDVASPETAGYIQDCHRRVAEVLEQNGTLFLDAASGPVQFAEYIEYSRGFEHRVCVDLSIRALRAARARLGDHALCVLADVARLPFRDGSFRAGVSLSTIYHVPAADQARAFRELDRVAAPGGRIAVAYSWGKYSALMLLPDALPTKLGSVLRRWFRRDSPGATVEPELYFHPRSPWWFRREVIPHVDAEIRVWRSLSVPFLRSFVPAGSAGRALLRMVFALERRFPRALGWLGQYPLIVLRGRAGQSSR